jgi:uncharacterized spore protein YtfJ
MADKEITDRPTDIETPKPPFDRVGHVLEKLLDTGSVSKVYGEPIRHGEALIIPAAEIVAIAGVGMGSGAGVSVLNRRPQSRGGGGGGGGGGKTLARSVAVIVSSPAGVEVKPVLDFTKIALAALTAAGFVMAAWKGMKKPR